MKTPSSIELCCALLLAFCGLGVAQPVAAAEVAGVHYQATSLTFANPHVYKAMMGIWLGANPVDPALKSELLGASI